MLNCQLMNFKNILIIGAPRSGTSFLKDLLQQHDNIYLSHGEKNFWSHKDFSPKNVKKYYQQLLAGSKEKEERIRKKIIHLGEKSPAYASMPERQIILLKKIFRNPLIIYMIRDNEQRYYSELKLTFEKKPLIRKINQLAAIDLKLVRNCLRTSDYSSNIENWSKHFGNNLKIIFFEDFIVDKQNHINKILNYLKLEFQNIKFDKKVKSVKPNFFFKLYFGFITKLFFKNDYKNLISDYQNQKMKISSKYKNCIF